MPELRTEIEVGRMTYRELFYKATRLINKNEITLGEYEEMTKPLDREIEQKPILDKIRNEIKKEIDRDDHADEYCDGYYDGMRNVLAIIDKYKAESEEE